MQMKITLKLLVLGGISLALLIALSSIKGITQARERRLHEVQQNIARSYAGSQQLIGPLVTLTYREIWPTRIFDDKQNCWSEKKMSKTKTVQVYPEKLLYDGSLQVQERYCGIFKAHVFQSKGQFAGTIRFPDLKMLPTEKNSRIEMVSAIASLCISDPRGISKTPEFAWNNNPLEIISGSGQKDHLEGIHAILPPEAYSSGQIIPFALGIDIHGMEQFKIVPIGSANQMKISSPWPHPSFIGDFLATTRSVSDEGFSAEWDVNGLACSAQQNFNSTSSGALQHT